MAEAAVPYGRKTQRPPAVKDVHIVWMTTGLGCDGDPRRRPAQARAISLHAAGSLSEVGRTRLFARGRRL